LHFGQRRFFIAEPMQHFPRQRALRDRSPPNSRAFWLSRLAYSTAGFPGRTLGLTLWKASSANWRWGSAASSASVLKRSDRDRHDERLRFRQSRNQVDARDFDVRKRVIPGAEKEPNVTKLIGHLRRLPSHVQVFSGLSRGKFKYHCQISRSAAAENSSTSPLA